MIKISNFLRLFKIDIRAKLFKSIYDGLGGNLRTIICGGAPLRPEIGKFFEDIGITLLNGYGITECSPLVSVNSKRLNDSRTVGLRDYGNIKNASYFCNVGMSSFNIYSRQVSVKGLGTVTFSQLLTKKQSL